MTTAAYEDIHPIPSYAYALKYIETTKPLRGTGNIPLGKRRDHTRFRIEKLSNEDIACYHYNTKLIVFHPDDTITIDLNNKLGNYTPRWSVSDTYFIQQVLWHYYLAVNMRRGVLMMKDRRSDQKHLLESTKAYNFKLDHATRTITPMNDNTGLLTLKLNRAAANNVRQRYGAFYRYMKGLLGVRKYEQSWTSLNTDGDEVTDTEYRVRIALEEFALVVPLKEDPHLANRLTGMTATVFQFDLLSVYPLPKSKPPINTEQGTYDLVAGTYITKTTTEPYEKWKANAQAQLALMSAAEDDPDQHEKFHKAFVMIALCALNYPLRRYNSKDATETIDVKAIQNMADEIIFKYHSDEVFETVPLKPGFVPSNKYKEWVTRER